MKVYIAPASLAVAVALLFAVSAAAAPAHFGAYLGCYNLNRMELSSEEMRVRSSGVSTYKNCRNTCASARASLVIVGTNTRKYECRCGFSVPPDPAKLAASSCNRGGSGVAVFYRHAAAETQQCRVFQPSMTSNANNFRAAYNTQNLRYPTGSMQLVMNGLDGGTRVETNYSRQTYGQFQVRGQVPCAEGVISAFYLRSSEVYPNTVSGNFDEIDFEFLNWRNLPCTIWLNSWKDSRINQEHQYGQADQRRILGWPSSKSTSSFVTYTIDWQPDYVSWYVDGKLLRSDRQGARIGNTGRTFQVPRRPMRPTFSLWTDMRRPNAFGGEIKPWEGPWRATWNRMRQVVCDRPAPASTPLGPSWMYA